MQKKERVEERRRLLRFRLAVGGEDLGEGGGEVLEELPDPGSVAGAEEEPTVLSWLLERPPCKKSGKPQIICQKVTG